jgi:glyoxylase-like metal-dependent hydrolase (beta-lactamase superfamily II)
LPPAAHTGCYLVGEGEVIAIDPGSPYPDQQEALVAAVAERGSLAAVMLTHHHGDHAGGAVALARALGAPIWTHADTAAALPGVPVDRHLADGEIVAIGGRTLRALHTPGHALGHLCFRDEASRAVVAGDMVAGIGTILIDPAGGHMATYLASLAAMLAAAPGALLPAHGPVIDDGPAKLREYIAHRGMREARVRASLTDAPRGAAELCAIAYADTPPFLWPLAERSLLAHLVKLVEDGVAVADGSGWRAQA